MRKAVIVPAAAAVAILLAAAAAASLPAESDAASARPPSKKFHFTQTLDSWADPGIGRNGTQIAMFVSPSGGSIFDGSMTYAASRPVGVMVLHELGDGQEGGGQPVWTVDGETHYALSLHGGPSRSGSAEFTGAAVALYSSAGRFAATATLDGWVRGLPTEVVMRAVTVDAGPARIELARGAVPAYLPLHAGLYNGTGLLYVVTDASGAEYAEMVSKRQGWRVERAPALADAPPDAVSDVYVFTNGVAGGGLRGYQDDVFSSTPGQPREYSALRQVSEVAWKVGQRPSVLSSEAEVLDARNGSRVTVERIGVVANMPQVQWDGGRMAVRADGYAVAGNETYDGAQLARVDEQSMTATFIAHRAWGPDGRTVYRIVTDAAPGGPAGAMGAAPAPLLAELVGTGAAADAYEFSNGLRGQGQLGFQPGISTVAPGEDSYTPIMHLYVAKWGDEREATVLQTVADVEALEDSEDIDVTLALPLNADFVVNSPVVDPFQVGGGGDDGGGAGGGDDAGDDDAGGNGAGGDDDAGAGDDDAGGSAGDDDAGGSAGDDDAGGSAGDDDAENGSNP